jgi:N-acetylneuraminate synthase
MVDRTRELERALGTGNKKIEENEKESVVVQQRCLRTAIDIEPGQALSRSHIDVLRPCPPDGIRPFDLGAVIGRRTNKSLQAGQHLKWTDLE